MFGLIEVLVEEGLDCFVVMPGESDEDAGDVEQVVGELVEDVFGDSNEGGEEGVVEVVVEGVDELEVLVVVEELGVDELVLGEELGEEFEEGGLVGGSGDGLDDVVDHLHDLAWRERVGGLLEQLVDVLGGDPADCDVGEHFVVELVVCAVGLDGVEQLLLEQVVSTLL